MRDWLLKSHPSQRVGFGIWGFLDFGSWILGFPLMLGPCISSNAESA